MWTAIWTVLGFVLALALLLFLMVWCQLDSTTCNENVPESRSTGTGGTP
jgi:hypothetical protein